ncbi:MAG: type II toxin-antitoxin system VapC family toxin [Terriglobales bacterium]
MRVLVDSDILIEVSRERNQDVLVKWTQLAESGTAILCSPVSSAELWAGALPREHEATAQLFRTLLCAPIDYETGRQAGDYLRQYRKSHGLELSDALIAAAAVINRAELWTRNRKHYPMKELTFY